MNGDYEEKTDELRLEKIKYEILRLEDENSKTKDYNYGEMVDRIKKIIKDGADGKIK